MPHRIASFGVLQTAKVIGAIYALLGVVFVPVFLVISAASPGEEGLGAGFALSLPLLYGVLGFIFAAIFCFVYNLVARVVGGIEVELSG